MCTQSEHPLNGCGCGTDWADLESDLIAPAVAVSASVVVSPQDLKPHPGCGRPAVIVLDTDSPWKQRDGSPRANCGPNLPSCAFEIGDEFHRTTLILP
jgi:hypothetical protein